MTTPNELTYFPVSGNWYDVEAPDPSGTTNLPQFLVVSAFVLFTPRLAPGTVCYVDNLDLGFTIPAPSLAVTASATGGTLTAGAKFWVVTATNANGETTKSNEVTATLTGSTSSAALSWPGVKGATGYKVYRGTAVGAENILVTTISSPATLAYTDTGAAGTSATPPATNTAKASADTGVPIAPIQARILSGELETIDRSDVTGVQLLSNSPILGLTNPLIYDVRFDNVVYADAGQTITGFAFTAPTDSTPINLTDPTLTRLPYDPKAYTNA